jgi:hypothetical protein
MVSYVDLAAACFTLVWVLYATLRIGPLLAKRSNAWGEVGAFLIFTAVELGILVLVRP